MNLSRKEIYKKEKFNLALTTAEYSSSAFAEQRHYGDWSTHQSDDNFLCAKNTQHLPLTAGSNNHRLQLTFSASDATRAYNAIKDLLFSNNNPAVEWQFSAPEPTTPTKHQAAQLTLRLSTDSDGPAIDKILIASFVAELEKRLSTAKIKPIGAPNTHADFSKVKGSQWKYTSYFQANNLPVDLLKKNALCKDLAFYAITPTEQYAQFYHEGRKQIYVLPFSKNKFNAEGSGFIFCHDKKKHTQAQDGENKLHINVDITEVHRAFGAIKDLLFSDDSPIYHWKIIDTDYPLFSTNSAHRIHQAAQITLYLSVDQDIGLNSGYSSERVQAISTFITKIEDRLNQAKIKRATISHRDFPQAIFHHPLSDIGFEQFKYISFRKESGNTVIPDERKPANTEEQAKLKKFLKQQAIFQALADNPPIAVAVTTSPNKKQLHLFNADWQPISQKINRLYQHSNSRWPKIYSSTERLDGSNTLTKPYSLDINLVKGAIAEIKDFAKKVGVTLPQNAEIQATQEGIKWVHRSVANQIISAYSLPELKLKVLGSYIDPSIANLINNGWTYNDIFDEKLVYRVHGFGEQQGNLLHPSKDKQQKNAYFLQQFNYKERTTYAYSINGKTVIMQPTETSCSAAAAAMLIMDHGKQINEEALFTTTSSYIKSIGDSIANAGLTPIFKRYDHIDKLAHAIEQHGSAIVCMAVFDKIELNKVINYHAMIVDAIDIKANLITMRDPASGLMLDLTLNAFKEAWQMRDGSVQINTHKRTHDKNVAHFSPKKQPKQSLRLSGNVNINYKIEEHILLEQAKRSAQALDIDKHRIPIFTGVERNRDGSSNYRLPCVNRNDENDIKWIHTDNDIFEKLQKNTQRQAELIKNSPIFKRIQKNLQRPSPSTLFNGPSGMAMLLKGWANWSWQPMLNDPGRQAELAFQAHHLINTLQLVQGSAQTMTEMIKLSVSVLRQSPTLPTQNTHTIFKSIRSVKRFGKALPYMNSALDVFDMGFSAYEFSRAQGKNQKLLYGTQLGISVTNLSISGTALLAWLSKAATVSRIANATALPLTALTTMASFYVNAVVSAKNIQEKALALAQLWINLRNGYQTPFISTPQKGIDVLSTAADVVITEINFLENNITFGQHRLYRANQEKYFDKQDSGHTAEFIEVRRELGKSNHQQKIAYTDASVLILPCTPSYDFYYLYEEADYPPLASEGWSLIKNIAHKNNCFYPEFWRVTGDVYQKRMGSESRTTRYLATDRKVIKHSTVIKIILDQRQRDLYIQKIADVSDAKKLTYDIYGDGGQYVLHLEKGPTISISDRIGKESNWITDIGQLNIEHDAINIDSQGLLLNDTLILRFTGSIQRLQLIDSKRTVVTAYAQNTENPKTPDNAIWHRHVQAVDWEKWTYHPPYFSKKIPHPQNNTALTNYLDNLQKNGQLAPYVEIRNYLTHPILWSGRPRYTLSTSAYYDSTTLNSDQRFLYLLHYELVDLYAIDGYEFTLDMITKELATSYANLSVSETDDLLLLAKNVDDHFPESSHFGKKKYLSPAQYKQGIYPCNYDKKKSINQSHFDGEDCAHYAPKRLEQWEPPCSLNAKDRRAKTYQYLQRWLTRLQDKINAIKKIESYIADAELAGVIDNKVYFYSKKYAVMWSGRIADKKNENAFTDTWFHFLSNETYPMTRVIKYEQSFLVQCNYLFSEKQQGSINYRVHENKVYLDSIMVNDTSWLALKNKDNDLDTILNKQPRAQVEDGRVEMIQSKTTYLPFIIRWVDKNESQKKFHAFPVTDTQSLHPTIDAQWIPILSERAALRGWVRVADKILIRPNLVDANGQMINNLPTDLAIAATRAYTTIDNLASLTNLEQKEIFCFYSIKEKAIWLQQGDGQPLLEARTAAQYIAIAPGIKKISQYGAQFFVVETNEGLVYQINFNGSLELIALTPSWLDKQTLPWWQAVHQLAQQTGANQLDVIDATASTPRFWYRGGRLIVLSPTLKNIADKLSVLHIQSSPSAYLKSALETVYLFDHDSGKLYRQSILAPENLSLLLQNEVEFSQRLDARLITEQTFKTVELLEDGCRLVTNNDILFVLDRFGKLHLHGVDKAWQDIQTDLASACQQLVEQAQQQGWQYDKTLTLTSVGWYHIEEQRLITLNKLIEINEIDDFKFIGDANDKHSAYIYGGKDNYLYEIDHEKMTPCKAISFTSEEETILVFGSPDNDIFSMENTSATIRLPSIKGKREIFLSGGAGKDIYFIDQIATDTYDYIEINNFDSSEHPQTDILHLSANHLNNLSLAKENNDLLIELEKSNRVDDPPSYSKNISTIRVNNLFNQESSAYHHLQFHFQHAQDTLITEYSIEQLIEAISILPEGQVSESEQSLAIAYPDLTRIIAVQI